MDGPSRFARLRSWRERHRVMSTFVLLLVLFMIKGLLELDARDDFVGFVLLVVPAVAALTLFGALLNRAEGWVRARWSRRKTG
ncbi:hypothetical protein [Luteipulveratus mongoliensis]|uniref:Uncharacterized protein n=1 Tax=Luteipulveratus mongoliensis TaxID=571913 RepID=A0A0K1JFN9_9MICO|nr:hypothetical protein [Luteipulveratus mongoliensis]AKU15524.1 hypothetical protein VV02_06055 [Luteipulveratus mongoliensis]